MVNQVIEFIKNNKFKKFYYNKWSSSEDYTLYYPIKKDNGEYGDIYLEIEFEGLFGFNIKLKRNLLYKSHS